MRRSLIFCCLIIGFRAAGVEDALSLAEKRIPCCWHRGAKRQTRNSDVQCVDYIGDLSGSIVARLYLEKDKVKSLERVKDGELDGVQTEWYVDGTLKSESTYENGVMNGRFKIWSKDGKLVGNYLMTQGSGTRSVYSLEGKLVEQEHYEGSKQNGTSVTTYSDSKICIVNYVNGTIIDRAYTFNADGTLSSFTFCNKVGKLNGPNVVFDKGHAVTRIQYYIKNAAVSKSEYLDKAKDDPQLVIYDGNPNSLITPEVSQILENFKTSPPKHIPLDEDNPGN